MDSRLHQDNADNRFLFRRARVYRKRAGLCVTACIRRRISSHIAVAITEWLPSKSEVLSSPFSHTPVILTSSPLQSK